jgi:hypothetical protein
MERSPAALRARFRVASNGEINMDPKSRTRQTEKDPIRSPVNQVDDSLIFR